MAKAGQSNQLQEMLTENMNMALCKNLKALSIYSSRSNINVQKSKIKTIAETLAALENCSNIRGCPKNNFWYSSIFSYYMILLDYLVCVFLSPLIWIQQSFKQKPFISASFSSVRNSPGGGSTHLYTHLTSVVQQLCRDCPPHEGYHVFLLLNLFYSQLGD